MRKKEPVPMRLIKILWDFAIQMDHLIAVGRPEREVINEKKRTCHLVYFIILVDHRVKIKENKKIDKYLDLARELKKSGGT